MTVGICVLGIIQKNLLNGRGYMNPILILLTDLVDSPKSGQK